MNSWIEGYKGGELQWTVGVALFCCVLRGVGIKALHINTITKEEEKKEKKKDMKRWKMTCGPFISPRDYFSVLPSLTHLSFLM